MSEPIENYSPRQRRLQTDFEALSALANESGAFAFEVCYRGELDLPESYLLWFYGPSLVRVCDPFEYGIRIMEEHQCRITLGPHYPRHMPNLQWITPIFHPNIAPSGAVCLGGYSSYWVPSLQIDHLCEMLWDMLCFRNFNLESPYNREAAQWLAQQTTFTFPLETRELRHIPHRGPSGRSTESTGKTCRPVSSSQLADTDIQFLED
ncbi:MAG: ubiquitin-conjugating enzyme E2 [Pirellulales bacterium]